MTRPCISCWAKVITSSANSRARSASLERAVQLAPKDSEYHDWLGKSYGRRAEESMFLSAMSWARKTHQEFEIAVELNPSNFEAQRDLIRYEMNAPGIVGGGDDKAHETHRRARKNRSRCRGSWPAGNSSPRKSGCPKRMRCSRKFWNRTPTGSGFISRSRDYYRDRQNAEKMGEAVAARRTTSIPTTAG